MMRLNLPRSSDQEDIYGRSVRREIESITIHVGFLYIYDSDFVMILGIGIIYQQRWRSGSVLSVLWNCWFGSGSLLVIGWGLDNANLGD
jgi:hypothetical protein